MSNTASPALVATRPVYWTVRRELWENRSIYIAPAIVGLLEVASLLIHGLRNPETIQAAGALDSVELQFAIGAGFGALALPILATALIAAAFYSLDALYSERRDRSILFWKSLPVSDATTVLAKALIPFAVSPAIALAIICATQLVTLLFGTVIVSLNGLSASILWSGLPVFTVLATLAYGMVAMALWYLPLYGWLFLVSAFAKRKTILWALLPPAGIVLAENFAFHTDHFAKLMSDRFLGFLQVSFNIADPHHFEFDLDHLTPISLIGSSGLWGGLVVAALFFFAAIQLRRYRGPV
jgi:ABC-2 type transport system permease protein